jgi:N-acetylneuraminic acid mutarotase
MTTARGYLAAGVVNNRIYAIGGNINSGNTSLATVEEYNPATNTWTNCGSACTSMPTARGSLAVGVVSNKIYAIGSLTAVEEGTFSGTLPTWNNPPTANAGADRSATVGVSESFTGSGSDQEGDSLSYAWDFNYQNGQFTIDSTLQNPTYTYTATGTYTVVLRVTDSKGAWNQDSLTVKVPGWTTKANMPTARDSLAVGVVNNKIYAIGGRLSNGSSSTTVEEYDPATNLWTTKASMPTGRQYLAAGVVNNKVYAFGGFGNCGNPCATVEEYDPATNTWTNCGGTCASMPTGRHSLAVAVVNNKIYAIGGQSGSSALTTVEEYDPATNTWTNCGGTCASMPTARWHLAAGVVNSKIYAIGGNTPSGCCLNTVEEYNPSTNTWTNCGGTCTSMPTARTSFVGVVNNKIYAIGGGDASGYPTAVEEYDPATNQWTTKTPMPTARAGLGVGVVNNKIYAIGGSNDSGFLTTVEEGTVE